MEQSLDFSKISPLSEAEIDKHGYKRANLWMIHHEKKIYGPYHIDVVEKIAIKFTKELEPSSACNLERGRWFFFFDNPAFQHRNDQTFYKPLVVTNEELLIYANEEEHGPYNFPELVHLLNQKKFKFVDLFSINKGESWRKLYEIDGLDRRHEEKDQLKLPNIPAVSAYSQEQLKFIQKAPSNHNVVLELKKIDPIASSIKQKKVRASSAQTRKSRANVRAARPDAIDKSERSNLSFILILVTIVALAWMFRGTISSFLSSSKKISFQNQNSRFYQRKVTKLNLALRPTKRAKIRTRTQPDQEIEVVREVKVKEQKKVAQKEFIPSTGDINNNTDDNDFTVTDSPAGENSFDDMFASDPLDEGSLSGISQDPSNIFNPDNDYFNYDDNRPSENAFLQEDDDIDYDYEPSLINEEY